ncbi:MAG TPA: glycoside hydrolase family 31 protein [Spirochaetales bacterium]|nr:glycoside hydrolase family 31 protein [Spirochaetales bacterium]
MKQSNDFAHDMIDLDLTPTRELSVAHRDVTLKSKTDYVIELAIPFFHMSHAGTFNSTEKEMKIVLFSLEAYGKDILRFSGTFYDKPIEKESVMLDIHQSLAKQKLRVKEMEKGLFLILDESQKVRAKISNKPHAVKYWSDLQRVADPMIEIELFPDGDESNGVKLMSYDHFFPGKLESIPLGYISDEEDVKGTLFSIYARHNEHFYGTGERFGRLDLAGKTITLENTDALGTASRKAYKNVPFYFSSRGYGLFIHSTAHMRLSFADISNRAVQGLIEEERLDLFFIGGKTPNNIVRNYRGLTGFSPELPLWSYGTWMSRMTYYSAKEVEMICERFRKENYPCDVIHLDSGYFSDDWVCDWKFSPERFPEPDQFIKKLDQQGFKISVWQTPNIGKENPLYQHAVEKGYLPIVKEEDEYTAMSDFSGQDFGGQIDLTNKEAVAWYKTLLRGLLDLGVKTIKTDFGEKILLNADFKAMSGLELHNLYALLYQKAAFETTAEYTDKPFIWGRSTWAGGQRYPLHWGGDTSSDWDGLTASLRGGLQFGLSGYTYWSHDVAGFHGLPEFMNNWPSENLYLRWTQFGVFSSHLRYHGASPREPWEYPAVASAVRNYLHLRYTLIPYILQEIKFCIKNENLLEECNGRPFIAPLLFDYPEDYNVWQIDDQYMFGRDFLVAPITNDEGVRDIYLPEGVWIDFNSGEEITGDRWLKAIAYPLTDYPVFVRAGATIPFYPELVNSTDEMDLKKVEYLDFDSSLKSKSSLAKLRKLCGLPFK